MVTLDAIEDKQDVEDLPFLDALEFQNNDRGEKVQHRKADIDLAQQSWNIAAAIREDRSAMKTLAVVSILFLPATFVAVSYSTAFLKSLLMAGAQTVFSFVIIPRTLDEYVSGKICSSPCLDDTVNESYAFRAYWTATALLTVIVGVFWFINIGLRRHPRSKEAAVSTSHGEKSAETTRKAPLANYESKPASPNTFDLQAYTPLSDAAAINDSKAILALLSRGADANTANVAGWTPLHIASQKGNLQAVKSLVSPADSNLTISGQRKREGSAADLKYNSSSHIDPRDNGGRSPLSIAIRSEQTEIALYLIQQGADVNLRDYYGISPIFHAIMYNNESVIDALIDRRCDATFVGKDKATVLHMAATYGTSSTLAKLTLRLPDLSLQCLPDIAAVDEQGRNALDTALQTINTSDQPPYAISDFTRFLTVIEDHQKQRTSKHGFSKSGLSNLSQLDTDTRTVLDIDIAMMIFSGPFTLELVAELDPWGENANTRIKILSGVIVWFVSMGCLAVLLKYLRSSFFGRRMVGAMKKLFARPPLPDKVRVDWFCVRLPSQTRVFRS